MFLNHNILAPFNPIARAVCTVGILASIVYYTFTDTLYNVLYIIVTGKK